MGVCSQAGRIAIFHKNIANMLNQFTAVIGEKNINISDMTNKSRGEVAYTMLDIENAATQDLVEILTEDRRRLPRTCGKVRHLSE